MPGVDEINAKLGTGLEHRFYLHAVHCEHRSHPDVLRRPHHLATAAELPIGYGASRAQSLAPELVVVSMTGRSGTVAGGDGSDDQGLGLLKFQTVGRRFERVVGVVEHGTPQCDLHRLSSHVGDDHQTARPEGDHLFGAEIHEFQIAFSL
jgi:hypothetical protein